MGGPAVPPPAASPKRRPVAIAFATGLVLGLAAEIGDLVLQRRRAGPEPEPPAPRISPRHLSFAQWRSVLARTWTDFNRDQITSAAAAVTFYGLLALFPALSAFVSLYGLFGDVETARHEILSLGVLMPEGAVSVLGDQLQRLAALPHSGLGFAFVVSLLISLWSTNAGIKALIAALNTAYESPERRSFVTLNLVSLTFTLSLIVLMVLGVWAMVAVPIWLADAHIAVAIAAELVRWPLLLGAIVTSLALLYRFGPCRHYPHWRWITPGALAAALGWVLMSLAFSWYVAHFGNYNRTYGTLGAVVGFMTWIWISITIVLFGAELNSELEQAG